MTKTQTTFFYYWTKFPEFIDEAIAKMNEDDFFLEAYYVGKPRFSIENVGELDHLTNFRVIIDNVHECMCEEITLVAESFLRGWESCFDYMEELGERIGSFNEA